MNDELTATDADDLSQFVKDELVTIDRPAQKGGPITINRKTIFELCSHGWTVTDICKTFGCDDNAIHKYFRAEIDLGSKSIGARLKKVLIQNCLYSEKVQPALLIFALKNYAGFSDEGFKDEADGGIVEFKVKFPAKPESKDAN